MALYNQVYGKYTPGTGSWLSDELYHKGKKNMYDREVLESYKSIIGTDLKRINVLNNISKFKVMDVGTGRQAIALKELGAHSVDHYDISLTNIKNFKTYIKKNKLSISSSHSDICNKNFNKKKKYNFIYLQGVIQHVSNPFDAIKNLSNALCQNGILWFYNYQAGAINHIYIEAFREILKDKIDFNILSNFLYTAGFNSKEVDNILDNYGCKYRYLIKNEHYQKYLKKCGLLKYYSKDVVDQSKGLDLKITTNACISAYKKEYNTPNELKSPNINHVDHFNPKNYIIDQQSFIASINIIKNHIIQGLQTASLSNYDLISICLPLFRGYLSNKSIQPIDIAKKNITNSFQSCFYLLKKLKNFK